MSDIATLDGARPALPTDGAAARVRDAAVRYVAGDAVHGGADRVRPAVPAQRAARVLEVAYLDELSDTAIDVIADRALDLARAPRSRQHVPLGGAIAAVDPEATAFSTRSAPFMVSIDGMWSDPAEDADTTAWGRSTWEAKEFANGDAYLNFTGLADEAPSAGVDTAFGRNLERLAQAKATYDPDNLFRINNNIKPV